MNSSISSMSWAHFSFRALEKANFQLRASVIRASFKGSDIKVTDPTLYDS